MVIFYFHDCGRKSNMILLMEEILHQFTLRLYHYLQGFIHPRWLFGISSINSMTAHPSLHRPNPSPQLETGCLKLLKSDDLLIDMAPRIHDP